MKRLVRWMLIFSVILWPIIGWGAYGEIQPTITSDISGLWHLNDNDSAEDDDSGNSYDLSKEDSPTFLQNAILAGGYNFDGTDDGLYSSSLRGDYTSPGDQTISVWVKIGNSSQTDVAIAGFFRSGYWESYGRGLYYDNGQICAMGEADNDNSVLCENLTDTTNWYHVVGVFSNSGALYINGEQKQTGSLDNSWEYYFGVSVSCGNVSSCEGNNTFNGSIDEVILWERALTASEIRAIYAMQKGAYGHNHILY